jgi:hypothetical protein
MGQPDVARLSGAGIPRACHGRGACVVGCGPGLPGAEARGVQVLAGQTRHTHVVRRQSANWRLAVLGDEVSLSKKVVASCFHFEHQVCWLFVGPFFLRWGDMPIDPLACFSWSCRRGWRASTDSSGICSIWSMLSYRSSEAMVLAQVKANTCLSKSNFAHPTEVDQSSTPGKNAEGHTSRVEACVLQFCNAL